MNQVDVDTVVVGAGQAGLAAGYHLQRSGVPFVILESASAVGESWRRRWDSLRLFTPACVDSLPGLSFPAPSRHLPTKDEMAGYLDEYSRRFDLPIELGCSVRELSENDGSYELKTGSKGGRFRCRRVIVATGANQVPTPPAFAGDLHESILQLHSADYRNPDQLRPGETLVVGAGNSGSEIALELGESGRRVLLAGEHPGLVPYVPGCLTYRVLRRVPVDSRLGRRAAAHRSKGGDPVVRVRPDDLTRVGVVRIPRVTGARADHLETEGGPRVAPANVVWCTGYRMDHSWIRLPLRFRHGRPEQDRGQATGHPGLHFLGLPMQASLGSDLVGGVALDAKTVVDRITEDS